MTIGATLAHYQSSSTFADDLGSQGTSIVFLIGLCVSQLFFRMTQRDGATRRYGGLGLGLTIARQVIHLRHGTIEAERGGGANFTISLPIRQ
ncbi:MAG: ATP-binding protein [Acidobacteriota bacterium]